MGTNDHEEENGEAGIGRSKAFLEIVDQLVGSGRVPEKHKEALLMALLKRESLGATSIGNNVAIPSSGVGAPASPQGPRILPNVPILGFASLGTSAVHVAGTWYRSEIYVPHLAQWTGIGVLNGATVGTDNLMVALYDTNGVLITNSAVAGALSAGADAFQNIALLQSPILQPGRYFVAVQCSGTTATTRRQAAANGSNTMTQSATGTFGTVPASFTPPTTFTADVGPIAWLYQ